MNGFLTDWTALPLDSDQTTIEPLDLQRSSSSPPLALDELVGLLASPDDATSLRQSGTTLFSELGSAYPIVDDRPVLLPQRALSRLSNRALSIDASDLADPLLQYLYLNVIKNSGGAVNSSVADVWYKRHLHRAVNLVADARGLVVDVGCDNPALSRRIFPADVTYVGIEPSFGPRTELCPVAMAEFLPFKGEQVDAVAFLTSLDHVLDYHTAIDEAFRILKPGGRLYLATLIWTERATLLSDNIHFHHFRQFEIDGVLRRFHVDRLKRYDWKDNDHRFGIYLAATKPSGEPS